MASPTAMHRSLDDRHTTEDTGHAVLALAALGTLGSVAMVVLGSRISAVPDPGHMLWWLSIPSGHSVVVSFGFYAAFAVLVVGWLGLGREAMLGRMSVKAAWGVLIAWGLPFFVGPPLFSRDLYSYISQGLIAHRGLNPYSVGPSVLGHGPLLSSVASVWRSTSSPYGPLFVQSSKFVAGVAGSSLTAQLLAFRALELVGVALIMVSLPRLARHLGTDPGVALWLGALSPLALLSFISSGHNDALMVGLLVCGVTLAVEGRLALGLAVCALAATVKLPAAAAVAFLVLDAYRSDAEFRRWKLLLQGVVVPVAVFVGVTVACGYGWSWLSPTALKIPAELHVLATPAVSVAVFIAFVAHAVGLHLDKSTIVSITQTAFGIASLLGCAWLLFKVHTYEVVRSLGLALVLVVVGSPTVWPWYLTWGLALLAATTLQRSKVLAVIAAFAMLVAGPSGNPLLTGGAYFVMTAAIVVAIVWLIRDRHWQQVVAGRVV